MDLVYIDSMLVYSLYTSQFFVLSSATNYGKAL